MNCKLKSYRKLDRVALACCAGFLATVMTHMAYAADAKVTNSAPTKVTVVARTEPISPDTQGKITLRPDVALITGKLEVELRGGEPNFGAWHDPAKDSASWPVRFTKAGKYKVQTTCSSTHGDVAFVVEVGTQVLNGLTQKTKTWDEFVPVNLGTVTVEAPGDVRVVVRAKDPAHWQAINMRAITIVPE